MDLKKALTLCAALLLVVGFSSDLIAQTAQPQSVRIRISSPADDAWAAIDDTVVVYVESLPGTSTLDSVQIAISADTSLANYGIPNSDAPTDTLVSSWMTTADTTIASYQRFIAQFPILPGGPEGAAKTLVAQAKVKKQGATVMRRINNLSTLESVTGLPTFELVGDAKKIGVDGKRPAAALSSAEIDTTGSGAAAWIGSGTEQMGYK
ncbi:MAG: hypothetical protein QGI83_13050, partial [Candidatus Latescibacteria bacterium]|nr:hypothetical protein [Candidatus Latescibacterota bacterium]